MPIFEYRCAGCGATCEILLRGTEPISCPQCGGLALDKLLSSPVVLTGKAARAPGHTCCGREERCDRSPCSGGGDCARG